jgi:oligogalacturonide lyase
MNKLKTEKFYLSAASIKRQKMAALTCLALCFLSHSYAQVINGIDYSDRKNVDKTFDMDGTDIFGQRFPAENLSIIDPVTGVKINALTTSRHNSSKIYQDHPNWTADGKYIVFSSNRNTSAGGNVTFAGAQTTGGRQFYAISMDNFEITQVTTGSSPGDLLLGHKKNVAYKIKNNQVIEFNIGQLLADSERRAVKDSATYDKVVATIPADLKPGGTCLDAEDNRIFFSTRGTNASSTIHAIDLQTNKTSKLVEVPFRTGHFQSNPYVSGEIIYCWETGGDSPQRIWRLSVDKAGKVVNEPAYKEKADEWVTHEVVVSPDYVAFNLMGHLDRLRKNPTGLVLHNMRTGETKHFKQPKEVGGFWHVTGTKDLKWLVGDTFDGNIYRINTATGEAKLLTTGHRPGTMSPFSTQAHAHQSLSPDGKWILINSSLLTQSDIVLIPLHPTVNR